MRGLITTLMELLGVCLVAVGLVGYDWRISAIVAGVGLIVMSKINS
jgi:hypothetical protein